MTTKAELEAEIANDAIRVIATNLVPDAVKEAAGVRTYDTEIMEASGRKSAVGRTIGWYVFDEGLPGEFALYKDQIRVTQSEIEQLVDYLENSTPYLRWEPIRFDREDTFANVTVWEEVDANTALQKQILIYRAQGAFTHREITNA